MGFREGWLSTAAVGLQPAVVTHQESDFQGPV